MGEVFPHAFEAKLLVRELEELPQRDDAFAHRSAAEQKKAGSVQQGVVDVKERRCGNSGRWRLGGQHRFLIRHRAHSTDPGCRRGKRDCWLNNEAVRNIFIVKTTLPEMM